VDYRNLDTKELGSVYESLLELHPQLNVDAAAFALQVVAGSERKTTGTHYTPTPLVNSLLDTALEPVVADRLKAAEERWRQGNDQTRDALRRLQEAAIVSIKVVDYAVGSGRMLIGAGRRLARHLACIRTGDEEPSPEALRAAMRDVVRHCLYGVDIWRGCCKLNQAPGS
jgi:type I restriction-modification system DNA methylase subunit